jgi:hypothetical protein
MATWVMNHNYLENQENGVTVVDFDTDTINVALITSAVAPDEDSHQFFDDLNANEVSGTNYVAGGETVTNMAVTLLAGTVTVGGDDVAWLQNAGGFNNARYAVVYKDTGLASTSPIIAHSDLGGDKGNVDGKLTLSSPNGFFDKS